MARHLLQVPFSDVTVIGSVIRAVIPLGNSDPSSAYPIMSNTFNSAQTAFA